MASKSADSTLVLALLAGLSGGGCGGLSGDAPMNAPETDSSVDAPAQGRPETDSGTDAPAVAWAGDGGPTVVASGLSGPNSIAVDSTAVYWTNLGTGGVPATPSTGSVMKCAIGGCGRPTVVASKQDNTVAIAVDSANVYWTNGSYPGDENASIMKCAIGGCGQPTVLASRLPVAEGLAVDITGAFFIGGLPGQGAAFGSNTAAIMTCSLSGGSAPTTLFVPRVSNWDSAILVRSGKVYWTERSGPSSSGDVTSCAVRGCSQPTGVVTLQGGQAVLPGLALDAKNVYFVSQYTPRETGLTVWKCAIGGCSQPTAVLSDVSPANGPIAVDSANVYWTTMNDSAGLGSVVKCSKSGCTAPTVLGDTDNPSAIAVDSTSVYWANVGHGSNLDGAGSVMKVAK